MQQLHDEFKFYQVIISKLYQQVLWEPFYSCFVRVCLVVSVALVVIKENVIGFINTNTHHYRIMVLKREAEVDRYLTYVITLGFIYYFGDYIDSVVTGKCL